MLRKFLCSGSCGLAISLAASQATAITRQDYDATILRARAGDYAPALTMLREQQRLNPVNLRAAYDHILIASWAGRPRETVQVYAAMKPPPARPPANVVAAVAAAYRDTRQWYAALTLYRQGRLLYPDQSVFMVGEIKTLADAGRPDDAIATGEPLARYRPADADLELALAYAYQKKKGVSPALEHTSRAYALSNQAYVTREYIHSLRLASLHGPALRLATQHPELLTDEELRGLQADYAAELTRLAGLPSQGERHRFDIADKAIGMYDQLIPAWLQKGAEACADVARLRADRLRALHARVRMADVVHEYEAMQAEGMTVPDHVLDDVASAYLYLRQPEKAVALYTHLTSTMAGEKEDASVIVTRKLGLFYALQESGQYRVSDELLAQANEEQPIWHWLKGQPTGVPNDSKLDVIRVVALAPLYRGDTKTSTRKLETLVAEAPNNSSLRGALALAYRAQERPRAAERELKMGQTLTPRSLEIETGQGYTALALNEWRQAEIMTDDVSARFPEDLRVQRLAREWAVHNKRELRVSGYRGITSDSPVSGSGDMGIETVLYSAPIHYNWRAYAGMGYAEGKFEEGKAHYRWQKAGAEWRSRGVTLEAEASAHSYGHGIKPGLRAGVHFNLNDQWEIGAAGELRSRQTPLRALKANVYSNSLELNGRWHADDTREWSFSLTPSHFTDGNKRLSAMIMGRQQFYASPALKSDLLLEISGSRNTQRGGNYYNPLTDLFAMPSIRLSHTLYRRYENALVQTFTAGAGAYAQKGYGTGAVASLGYGMHYQANDVVDIGATITATSRPYDGKRERDVRITLELGLRF